MSIIVFQITVFILTSSFEFGSTQPSIADVILFDHSAIIRWEVQCSDMTEISDILFGCSQSNFPDNNLTIVRHIVNKRETYREKILHLHNGSTIGNNWKCVFKLLGVHYENCVTEDSLCVLIDVSSFARPISGIWIIINYIATACVISIIHVAN